MQERMECREGCTKYLAETLSKMKPKFNVDNYWKAKTARVKDKIAKKNKIKLNQGRLHA